MESNDLFRLVNLRRSKTDRGEGAAAETPPDPRLRHRDRIAAQSRVDIFDRATQFDSLKTRHAELRRTVRDLESVQRAVVKTAMLREQKETPVAGRSGAVPASAAEAGAFTPARAIIVDEEMIGAIEGRLSPSGRRSC
jgi:hypothetical protein